MYRQVQTDLISFPSKILAMSQVNTVALKTHWFISASLSKSCFWQMENLLHHSIWELNPFTYPQSFCPVLHTLDYMTGERLRECEAAAVKLSPKSDPVKISSLFPIGLPYFLFSLMQCFWGSLSPLKGRQ